MMLFAQGLLAKRYTTRMLAYGCIDSCGLAYLALVASLGAVGVLCGWLRWHLSVQCQRHGSVWLRISDGFGSIAQKMGSTSRYSYTAIVMVSKVSIGIAFVLQPEDSDKGIYWL